MKLRPLDGLYAIVRLEPDTALPGWVRGGSFWSVTRSGTELSIVCSVAALAAAGHTVDA